LSKGRRVKRRKSRRDNRADRGRSGGEVLQGEREREGGRERGELKADEERRELQIWKSDVGRRRGGWEVVKGKGRVRKGGKNVN